MRKEMKGLFFSICLIAPTLAMNEEANHFPGTTLLSQEHENLQPLLVAREQQPGCCEEFMTRLRRFRDDYCCSICVGSFLLWRVFSICHTTETISHDVVSSQIKSIL